MKTEYFEFSPMDFTAALTGQHHRTLGYLLGKGYITAEVYDELIDTTMVSAIKNNKSFGRRLLEKWFGASATEDTHTFVIVEIATIHETVSEPVKTKLHKIVDNEKT